VTIVSLAVLVSMNARLEQSQKVINIQSIRTLAQNVELVLTFVLLKQFTWDNRIVCMTHNKGILLGEFPYFFTYDTLNLYTDEKGFFILSLDILFFVSSRKYLFQALRQE